MSKIKSRSVFSDATYLIIGGSYYYSPYSGYGLEPKARPNSAYAVRRTKKVQSLASIRLVLGSDSEL
jgi:hypothetical protein